MRRLIAVASLILTSCATTPHRGPSSDQPPLRQLAGPVQFFSPPADMHETWKTAIAGAHSTIVMEMFHLTDQEIVSQLLDLTNIDIALILDSGNLLDAGTAKI